MRIALVMLLAVLVAGCGQRTINGYRIDGYDQGGHPICHEHGIRVYDCDADPKTAVFANGSPNPHGIWEGPPYTGEVVLVPGPLVAKRLDDLTPEERAWLAAQKGR